MYQVSLRNLDIVGLKNQNKILEDAALKKEEERKAIENKYKELLDKNDKLVKQLSGQLHIQGEKHIIWDMIITEAGKLRPSMNYILDKEIVIHAAKQSCSAVKEVLNNKLIDTSNNIVSFLNGLLDDDLKTTNIKDKISVIDWERMVVGKHQHLNTVQVKIDIM